jgi:cytoskeletal protein CcmA (bactofilin family)
MSSTSEPPEIPARRFTDAASGNVTVIPAGLSVEGELSCGESLEVAGRVRGQVDVLGLCHIHANAWVVGEVTAGDAVVEGELEGPLTARGRVELRPTARVRGDIEADSVAMADGCYFEGHIHMAGGPRAQPTSFHEKRAPRPGRS